MTEEEFFARVDEAKQEIASGKGRQFGSIEDLDRHIRALWYTSDYLSQIHTLIPLSFSIQKNVVSLQHTIQNR